MTSILRNSWPAFFLASQLGERLSVSAMGCSQQLSFWGDSTFQAANFGIARDSTVIESDLFNSGG
jgi:hypothetical protein